MREFRITVQVMFSAFGGRHDWSVFENEHAPAGLTYGKLTGTTVLLKACAELKTLDPCA